MKNNIEIDSTTLELRSEDLSANDILRRYINIGLRIGKDAGVCNFWDYDTDWINFHDYTEDELDTIYHDASIEKEMWSEGETDDYNDSINLVMHSIDAIRGDMKAAIFAGSKIAMFSHDDFLYWEKEKISSANAIAGKAKKGKLSWRTRTLLIVINYLCPESYTLKGIRWKIETAEERVIEDIEMELLENEFKGCTLERERDNLTIIYQGKEVAITDNQINNLLKNHKDKLNNNF